MKSTDATLISFAVILNLASVSTGMICVIINIFCYCYSCAIDAKERVIIIHYSFMCCCDFPAVSAQMMMSGSGSEPPPITNDPPTISGCPVSPVILQGLLDPVVVVIPFEFSIAVMDEGSGQVNTAFNIESSFPIDFLNMSRDSNGNANLLLPGNAFSVMNNFIQINITLTAVDLIGAMSEPCNVTLEIMLFEASLCVNPHPPLLGILVTLSSVTLVVDIPRASVKHVAEK